MLKEARVSPAEVDLVQEYIVKYLTMLNDFLSKENVSLPPPELKFMDNYASVWLGRCSWYAFVSAIRNGDRGRTVIQLQKSILHDAKTLERVVAHEMCHHAEFLHDKFKRGQELLSSYGNLSSSLLFGESHGKEFWKYADHINSIEGSGFITQKSDEAYVQQRRKREYLLLLWPHGSGFRWTYALKLTTQNKFRMKYLAQLKDGRFTITDDLSLTQNLPTFKSSTRNIAVGQSTPEQVEYLKGLYDNGKKFDEVGTLTEAATYHTYDYKEEYTLPAGTTLYHGSPEPFASSIKSSKKLRGRNDTKLGLGMMDEGGMIWFSTAHSGADYWAGGPEAGAEEFKSHGQVFQYKLAEPAKIVNRYYKLNEKQAQDLNDILGIPDYKRLSEGDSLNTAVSRAGVSGRTKFQTYKTQRGTMYLIWPLVLDYLGAAGIDYQGTIAIAADELEIADE